MSRSLQPIAGEPMEVLVRGLREAFDRLPLQVSRRLDNLTSAEDE